MFKFGTLFGVSVGVGDPELITIKGLNLLQKCPVIAFPAGVGEKKGRAETIIKPWLQENQILLHLNFPYVQNENYLQEAWKKAAEEIWQYLSQGKDVVFACLGDIGLYSTFTYLAQTLRHDHPEVTVKSVPGVTSPLAAAAELGIPLTVLDQRLAILPAIYSVSELKNALNWANVVVLLKFASVYGEIYGFLSQNELLSHCWVVENISLPDQVVYYPLKPDLKFSYFSVLIVKNL